MNDEEKIELKSDKVNDILQQVPIWTIRWGSAAILFAFFLLFGVAFFINYPDELVSRITVTSSSIPKEIRINPISSRTEISHVMVDDNQQVRKGEVLAVIKNPAVYADIVQVSKEFETLRDLFFKKQLHKVIPLSKNFQLGEIQDSYLTLIKAIEEYKLYKAHQFDHLNLREIFAQVSTYQKLKLSILSQKKIVEEQLELSAKNYKRDSTLNSLNYTAQSVFDEQKKNYLNEKIEFEKLEAQLINIDLSIRDKKQSIVLISADSIKTQNTLLVNLNAAIIEFENQLHTWEDAYLLCSPMDGITSFTQPIEDGKHIKTDQEVMMILPEHNELFAYTFVPSNRIGKVAVKQEVRIRFDGFPFKEYGVVRGKVNSISEVAVDGKYYVQVTIPDTLETNFHRKLAFSSNMQGEAHIVTEDMRFLERIFYEFRSVFTNN
jgi:multidrug resistance efflux pump